VVGATQARPRRGGGAAGRPAVAAGRRKAPQPDAPPQSAPTPVALSGVAEEAAGLLAALGPGEWTTVKRLGEKLKDRGVRYNASLSTILARRPDVEIERSATGNHRVRLLAFGPGGEPAGGTAPGEAAAGP